MKNLADVYSGKRVLVTGHTGFKGGWLSLWLRRLGADVVGYSLEALPKAFFNTADVGRVVKHLEGDIRDRSQFVSAWRAAEPDIVFHLAAQPLVRKSYRDPLETVTTNVVGTSNVLETAREMESPVTLVLITSDKCYENHEVERGYVEEDQLGGRDVYSGSKAAAEILISSFRRSFFAEGLDIAVASGRAGNVIGGGDWSDDRIVPDTIRSLLAQKPIEVRSPTAVRPWQHVLEPLSGYLRLGAELQSSRRQELCSAWNFGPEIHNTRTVGELVDEIIRHWGSGTWHDGSRPNQAHEADLLRLDIGKAKRLLEWSPRWSFEEAVGKTVAWYRAYSESVDMHEYSMRQIVEYADTSVPTPSC